MNFEMRRSVFAIVFMTLALASCSSTSRAVVQSGDSLDDLLHGGKRGELTEKRFFRAVTSCMNQQGFSYSAPADPVNTYVHADGDGSGAVARLLWQLDHPLTPTEPKAVPKDFDDALHSLVVINGERVEGGCSAWADTVVSKDPIEMLRTSLRKKYDDVVVKIVNDPRRIALDLEWSKCMADAGFSGLHKLGDQIDVIHDRITAAIGDREPTAADRNTLERLLAEDRSITELASRCFDPIVKRQLRYRSEFDSEFIHVNSAELEELANADRVNG